MSQVPMVQCVIIGRQADAEPVLEGLQEAGVIHLVPMQPEQLEQEMRELSKGAEVSPDAAAVRTTYERLQQRLEALRSVAVAPARLQIDDLTYTEVGERIDALSKRRVELLHEIEQLEAQRDMLAPWGQFDTADVQALERAGVRVVFVELGDDEWRRLDRRVAHATASVRGDVRHVVLFDPPEGVGGNIVDVPLTSLHDVRARLEKSQAAVRETQRELGRVAHYAPLIAKQIAALRDRMAVLDALGGALSAGPIFALEGYLPREQVVDLQRALAPFACALRIKDAPLFDERVPVKLRNRPLVAGFETIVEAFSGMRYGEKDFTWAVGLLFVVFGALCFLDAGYGLMLAILGLALRIRGSQQIGGVFMATGVVSVIIGMMAGQFFGLIIGQTVMLDHRPLLTLSSEPYHAFLFSLFVGIVAMAFSYAMAIWQRGLRTDSTGALLLVLASLAAVYANMASGFVYEVLSGATPTAEYLEQAKLWGNRVAYALGVAAFGAWVAFPGPVFGEDARVGNILWTLYSGTTGFVQDVLSHMRLFGIALSGGIMALVVNEMAARFSLPVTALFAVVGHFFVFLLSLLSLYIHTNRLIFLEWGSKCIDGGANFYSPLRRSSV